MEIRPVDKLIITLLIELQRANNVDSSFDTDFIESVIEDGDHWALSWKYPGLFPESETPPEVLAVCDILAMWDSIEYSFHNLDDESKSFVTSELGREPKFTGFDGNNEYLDLSIANTLIEKLNRFQFFRSRYLNSHMPTRQTYASQLVKYRKIQEKKDMSGLLSAEEIIEVVKRH